MENESKKESTLEQLSLDNVQEKDFTYPEKEIDDVKSVDYRYEENDWKGSVQRELENLVVIHELPKGSLTLATNISGKTGEITSYSLCISEPTYPENRSVSQQSRINHKGINIKEIKDELELSIGEIPFGVVPVPKDAVVRRLKSKDNVVLMRIQKESPSLVPYLVAHMEHALSVYVSSATPFGCCSKFIECSEAKKCVHENRLYSKACQYRRNLEAGHVFYGKSQEPDYVVVDVENPNARGNSLCAIGVIVVKNREVVDRKYSLINPEDSFDKRNMDITGINPTMVEDAPTFKEYWTEIRHLLENNTIVGHNIPYDLSVISKSLERYHINAPDFKYICTLELSRQYIKAESHNLGKLMETLNYQYDQHNALADAEASRLLFNYIVSKEHLAVSKIPVKNYSYTKKLKNTVDEKLSSNINELFGIIKGITADGIVDGDETEYLRKWIAENTKYQKYAVFEHIIKTLNDILEDGIITPYERVKLITLVKMVDTSKVYSKSTLSLQVLQGLVKGIVCNRKIVESEVCSLNTWLDENYELEGVYPYDKIYNIVKKTLADGVITEEENEELVAEFQEVMNPTKEAKGFELRGKTFCLTGEFGSGTKEMIAQQLIERGAVQKNNVSGKLDYLFVGGLGSEAWKFGSYGGKVLKAKELKEKGKNIQIVEEKDLVARLKQKDN